MKCWRQYANSVHGQCHLLCHNKMVFCWSLQNKWFEGEIMTWWHFFFGTFVFLLISKYMSWWNHFCKTPHPHLQRWFSIPLLDRLAALLTKSDGNFGYAKSNKTRKTKPNFSFLTPLWWSFFEQKYFSGCPVCLVSAPKACWCFLVTRNAKPSGHSFREMPFSLPRPFASARLMALKNLLKEISYTKTTCRIFVQHGYTKSDFFFLAIPNDEISNRGC